MILSACLRRSKSGRSDRICAAIDHAFAGQSVALSENPLGLKFRPPVEALEGRVLLSAYTMTQVGYPGANATGANPRAALVADPAGNFYGTTTLGGAYGAGTVFEIANGSDAITTLASFNGTDGASPLAGVTLDGSGNLYGATYRGGANDDGAIFEIASGSIAITAIASFNGINGQNPLGCVAVDPAGNLYGTTYSGGAGAGTVFKIGAGSGAITTLYTFAATSYADPGGDLAFDSYGNLYGTTEQDGLGHDGTVFEFPSGSNLLTTIATFDQSDGQYPQGKLTFDASGNLYGTTESGLFPQTVDGTVFEIPKGTSTISTLAAFNGTNGELPFGGVTLDSGGNLYGTTESGGAEGYGTVFEIPKGGNTIEDLLSFNPPSGAQPYGGIIFDQAGNLWGTTSAGGKSNCGTVFKLDRRFGPSFVTSFAAPSGTNPTAGVTLDAEGNLYGPTVPPPTASAPRGPNAYGTIFEVAQGSTMANTVSAFNNFTGRDPFDAPTIDAAGDLFGTTYESGTSGDGVVFEIPTGSNTVTDLASFNGTNGQYPYGGVTLDRQGDLFGTTNAGGANGVGTVWEIVSGSNTITTLDSFAGSYGKANPYAGVTLDADGNLYGTIAGEVFEVARGTNVITTLAYFSQADGSSLRGGVTLDPSGNLYGTAETGGANNDGTVWEIPAGSASVTVIASFDEADGAAPYGGITLDPSGDLFGTTYQGGAANDGTVFEIARGSTTITTLVTFNGTNGKSPKGSITPDGLGNFYGTTNAGGVLGNGTVFELTANSAVSLIPAGGQNPSNAGQPLTFTATISGGIPDGQAVKLLDASHDNAVLSTGTISNGLATLTVPAGTLAIGTHNLIAVYSGNTDFAPSQSPAYQQTVITDPLPAYITASPGAAYGYDSVTGTLALTNGTLTFTADDATAPFINLNASGPASGVFFDSSEHLAGLTLSGGAQATVLSLGSARTHDNHNVLVIGTLGSASNPTFSIDPQSKLDLIDNDLIVHTGSSDSGNGAPNQLGVAETIELGAVRALALRGRNVAAGGVLNGTWTGNGLTSSAAASADSAAGYEQVVLAVVQNSDQILGKDSAWTVGNFSEPLGSNDILVKYTYNGDAALEGYVGDASVTIVNGFYDKGVSIQADWAFGDFTGAGQVNDDDITILDGLYGNGTAASGLPQL